MPEMDKELLNKLSKALEKNGFVPVSPDGSMPPMPADPAMGGMPMDPAMMGGMPPGMPMDPGMGGMPPGMPMDPGMGAPPPPDAGQMAVVNLDDLRRIVQEVTGSPSKSRSQKTDQLEEMRQEIAEIRQQFDMLMSVLMGGGQPPMDPMMGGQPPIDPMMGGGMPMDPMMGGGVPPEQAGPKFASDKIHRLSELLRK